MINAIQEIHQQKLDEVAADYTARGYQVSIEPQSEDLPEFLMGFHPDLIARSPTDSVVVEIKVKMKSAATERYVELARAIQQQPGWRFSLVVFDPQSDENVPVFGDLIGRDEIVERLEKANGLLENGNIDAAFLLLWASVEALMRRLATKEGLPLERVAPSALIREMYSMGVLEHSDMETALQAYEVRNASVHGFVTPDLKTTVQDLSRLAQQLLSELDAAKE